MEMTIFERINKFIKKYPEPKQYPFRLKTSGREYGMYKDGTYMHSPCSKGWWIAAYRYDEETDLFEAATIHIDCHKSTVNRKWEYHHRYFITRDRKVYDVSGHEPTYFISADSAGDKYTYDKKHYIMAMTNLTTSDDFAEQFEAFNKGDLRTAGTPWCAASRADFLRNWIVFKERAASINPKNKDDVKMCLAIKLDEHPDVNDNDFRGIYYYYSLPSIAIVEIHDEAIVFRQFTKTDISDSIKENKRVYFFSPKKVFYLDGQYGLWKKNGSFTNNQFCGKLKNASVLNDTRYSFINEFIKDKSNLYFYVVAMRDPIYEQMWKMGADCLVKRAFKDNYTLPITTINNDLGVREYKKKDKTYRRSEMTPKQLKFLSEYLSDNYISWTNMATFKNSYDVLHMDFDKFKMLVPYINRLDCVRYIGWNRTNSVDNEEKVIFERLCRISEKEKDDSIFTVYRDTRNYYNRHVIDTNPAHIKKANELRRLHDAAVEIEVQQKAEADAKRNAELDAKRKEVDKKRKNWNYEEDNYLIRLPNMISEITLEGQKLHHCVGGYTQRHAVGDTTILFLREKANPDKAFYTIEVKDNHVVQIHGFANKWIQNDPDAVPTVIRWLRKNNIGCNERILTSTAKGYCDNGMHVQLPIVDGKRGV